MRWWQNQTLHSPTGHVKDYSLYPKSNEMFEASDCSVRNRYGGLGKVGSGKVGGSNQLRGYDGSPSEIIVP